MWFAERDSLPYFFSVYTFFFLSPLSYCFWRVLSWTRNCFNLQLILPHCWPVPSKVSYSMFHNWLDFPLCENIDDCYLCEVSGECLPQVLLMGFFQKTPVVASQIGPELSGTFQSMFGTALIFSSLNFTNYQLKEILAPEQWTGSSPGVTYPHPCSCCLKALYAFCPMFQSFHAECE